MRAGHIHMGKLSGDKEGSPPAYDGKLLRRIWGFVRPHRRMLFSALLMLPLSAGFNLLQPYLMKTAIDRAIVPRDMTLLPMLAAALVGAILLERFCQFGETLLMQLCGQRAMHDLRVAAHRHLLTLRSAYFDRSPVGKLMTRVTNDVEAINEAFAMGLVSVVGDLITLTGIVVVMLWLSPALAAVALAVTPLLLLIVEVFRRLLRAVHRLIRRRIAQINGTLQEHINGMSVVQIFGQQRKAMGTFDAANSAHRDAYNAAIRYDASLFALVEMLGSVTVALLLWYGGVQVVDSAVTFGLLVAFLEYVQRFFIPIRDLSAKYTVMQQAMASSERVFGLLDTDEPEGKMDDALAAAVEPDAPLLRFDRATFSYDGETEVLRGLSFELQAGERLAVVGATGSGKSTLIRLLTRLYELQPRHSVSDRSSPAPTPAGGVARRSLATSQLPPRSYPASAGARRSNAHLHRGEVSNGGRIELDGRDLRGYSPEALRRRLVVVSQDTFMFSGTVAENITLGDPALTPEQTAAAAARVGLDSLLEMDHEVAERGANLSAGERQLIAFARALVRDPEVLILDEATASVDPETERVVQQGVELLMKGRTSIVIAHRLSTIEAADRILVMSAGQVKESGTHEELLAAEGLYAELYRLQYI